MEQPLDARRTTTRRARWAALVAVLAVSAAAVATPVAAQGADDPPSTTVPGEAAKTPEEAKAARVLEETLARAPEDVPASPDDVFVAVVDAQHKVGEAATARLGATQRSTQADAESFTAAVALDQARKATLAATIRRDADRRSLASERDLLSKLTVRAYVTGGEVSNEEYRAIIHGDTTDPARGRTIMFDQVLKRQEVVTEAARVTANGSRKALVRARNQEQAATTEANLRSLAAATRAREEADAVQAHEGALLELQQAQSRLRAGRTIEQVPLGVALIGLPRLDAEDLAGWFATSPYRPRVVTPITDYARWFIAEGGKEGIRGDVAFAQAVLETGGFANEDSVSANNFSGIGHCDLCPSGWTFPTPELGVRAQIQLLKSYAIAKPEYVDELVDKRLRGPAGCCPTWGDLTTVWATDPGYGPKVMLLYTSMVQYALDRRAAGQGFDDPVATVD